MSAGSSFACKDHVLPLGKQTYVLGIVNVTPDSFSDGGLFFSQNAALKQAEKLLQAGADIIDVGGESTRPGATGITADEEKKRVIPLIRELVNKYKCIVSIDTSKSVVAGAALEAGAAIVNDVTGLMADRELAVLAASYRAGLILMYNARLQSRAQRENPDLIKRALDYLSASVQQALAAGVDHKQIICDPGIGFGVTAKESVQLIRRLAELKTLGYPILVGASRKRFILESLPSVAEDRLLGTAAAVAISIVNGADFVRVHDVPSLIDLVRMTDVLQR